MPIQGQALEITVTGCTRLRDTEWISRQDPYVCLDYAGEKFRTSTCTDGGRNPTFQEKIAFSLVEGRREIKVDVWNSNTFTSDKLIGSGKILLHKVLSEGSDYSGWTIQTKNGKFAGELNLLMNYYTGQSAGDAICGRTAASPRPTAPPPPSAAYVAATNLGAPYASPLHAAAASYPSPAEYALPRTWPCQPVNPVGYPPPPSPHHPLAHAPQAYPPGDYSTYPPPPYRM